MKKSAGKIIFERLTVGLKRRRQLARVDDLLFTASGLVCRVGGVKICIVFHESFTDKELDDAFDKLERFFDDIGELQNKKQTGEIK